MAEKKTTHASRAAKKVTIRTHKPRPADKAASPAPKPDVAAPARTTKTKQKLVRDSFTIPKDEHALLEGLKRRAADLRRPTKKSELLRAGVAALRALDDRAFLAALDGIPSLKTGRPKGAAGKATAKA
jgi:hypothetical protein